MFREFAVLTGDLNQYFHVKFAGFMSSFADHAVSHFVGWLETPSQMNYTRECFH